MGLLGNVLRQLDARPSFAPPTASLVDESNGQQSLLGDHDEMLPAAGPTSAAVAHDEPFGTNLDFLPAATVVTADVSPRDFVVPATVFSEAEVNRTIEFAEAALQSIQQADASPHGEMLELSAQDVIVDVGPSGALGATPLIDANLPNIVTDRSYGQFWDSMASAMNGSPPWSIVVAESDADGDPSWLIPAATAFVERSQCRVLLIDACSRQRNVNAVRSDRDKECSRGLANSLGLCPQYGFGDVLQSRVDWPDALVATPLAEVFLLADSDQSEFDASAAILDAADLLAEMKSEFGLILIRAGDCSCLSVHPLLAASDAAVMLVEIGRTARASATATTEALYSAGVWLVGCVTRG